MHSYVNHWVSGLLLFPLNALALPHNNLLDEIHVAWSYQRASGVTAMAALNEDFTRLLAQAEGSTLSTGLFSSQPLTFDVDDSARGSLTHGSTVYKIHSDRQRSGGIACVTIYSDTTIFIDCSVPWKEEAGHTLIGERSSEVDKVALRESMGVASFPAFILTAGHVPENSEEMTPPNLSTRDAHAEPRSDAELPLEKRQCVPWPGRETLLRGDGNPHQNYFHSQTSLPLPCGEGTCSVSVTDTEERSYEFSFDISPFEWITGGFAVSRSFSTSVTYDCDGGPGETVCTWYKMAHTAYTVENWTIDRACNTVNEMESVSVLKSPNEGGVGNRPYCVRGACRLAIGDSWWDNTPVPGGPRG